MQLHRRRASHVLLGRRRLVAVTAREVEERWQPALVGEPVPQCGDELFDCDLVLATIALFGDVLDLARNCFANAPRTGAANDYSNSKHSFLLHNPHHKYGDRRRSADHITQAQR